MLPFGGRAAAAAAAASDGRLAHLTNQAQAWFDSVGMGGNVRYGATGSSLYQEILQRPYSLKTWIDPPLPPGLAPIPPVCRLLAFAMVFPVLVIALLDFAGYAVFRTLGLRRRRVRVKTRSSRINYNISRAARIPKTAPLLSPGTYDADTLLQHRARSFSSASTSEEREAWIRSGGDFARVKATPTGEPDRQLAGADTSAAIAASADGAAAEIHDAARKSGVPSAAGNGAAVAAGLAEAHSIHSEEDDDEASEEEDPRDNFARVQGVGVEGALGFNDTDGESDWGDHSPVASRRPSADSSSGGFPAAGRPGHTRRRSGSIGGGTLGFTPMNRAPSSTGGASAGSAGQGRG